MTAIQFTVGLGLLVLLTYLIISEAISKKNNQLTQKMQYMQKEGHFCFNCKHCKEIKLNHYVCTYIEDESSQIDMVTGENKEIMNYKSCDNIVGTEKCNWKAKGE